MTDETNNQQDEHRLISERREKLRLLRAAGIAFPNDFRRDVMAGELHAEYGDKPAEFFDGETRRVRVAGRMMAKRIMGKASFTHIQDMSGRIQLFLERDSLPEGVYQQFKGWDVGDIVGAEGVLFKTRTGELSVKVERIRLLTKSLRPLPEKFHGLADQETRYRQRYLDLIMSEPSRNIFRLRTQIVQYIRNFLNERGFLEVETPMMQMIPGGATARPFITHHNALDMQLFLRIAPELYLKRLVVGGFEKVYEINRNFRNEGLSTRHNPEFTMMEFYEAYREYRYLMDYTEALIRHTAVAATGSTTVVYQGNEIELGKPFDRLTIVEAIRKYNPQYTVEQLNDRDWLIAQFVAMKAKYRAQDGIGGLQLSFFEETTEALLIQPTFIIDYPAEVSPLARRSDSQPDITERFELFITGREMANGFSELNDAEDQAERFMEQVRQKEAGDEEAMHYDADFIRALEHGLPPTGGCGIGIDRLVMLLTDSPSIRDVILFPQMRREA